MLGAHDAADGRLRYVGNVGAGFSEADRQQLRARLAQRRRLDDPLDEVVPTADVAGARWVAPELIGDVAYREWIRPEHRAAAPVLARPARGT
jgi:bifunctional non-homologous end joining protein LigD